MRVAVAAPGRSHAFDLARELHRRGALARLLTTIPEMMVRRALPHDVPVATAPWLAARGWLHAHLRPTGADEPSLRAAFARFTVRHIPVGADLLTGWPGATLEAIPEAHGRGMRVVIEHAAAHVAYRTEVLTRAYRRFEMDSRVPTADLIERQLAEYAAADAVVVPTRFAAETFIRRGLARDRVIINPPGVALARFRPGAPRGREGRLRILFVGRIGVRDGVPWLLRAFAMLDVKAELQLIGPIEAGMDRLFRLEPMAGVTVRGPVAEERLPGEYAAADIFCLPALDDGLPVGVYQAMASGLPVVTTAEAGAGDIIRQGVDGIIVPCGEPRPLTAALEELAGDVLARRAMGGRARLAVETGAGWEDYGRRAMEAYEALLRRP